jgi:cell wall-associated NlpC family hydrolase
MSNTAYLKNKDTLLTIPENISVVRKQILQNAQQFIGTPYCYGGESPFCSDCSGFTKQLFAKSGINIPRTAQDQFTSTVQDSGEPIPGDLLFFRYKKDGPIAHVGIFTGKNSMIHASEKKGITISSLEYMIQFLIGFGRVSSLDASEDISSK